MLRYKKLIIVIACAAYALPVAARYERSNSEGPIKAGKWGLIGGIGAAPGFFKNRGFRQAVFPRAGLNCPVTTGIINNTLPCDQIFNVLTTPQNVFQQDTYKTEKFNQQFSNGVLHITGQITYNVCCNAQFFLEGIYNRASGKDCVNTTPNFSQAPEFCGSDCNSSCSSSSSCAITGASLITINLRLSFCSYQAYGGYVGSRYYWNRMWCDRIAFFGGFKFGMLHRKQVYATNVSPVYTEMLNGDTNTYVFADLPFTFVRYCASNAVSGGIQVGLDYGINDCLSFLVGVELVATAPFKSNRNVVRPSINPTVNGVATVVGFSRNFNQQTNVLIAPTGTFIQFPVWAGLRWEFDWRWCKRACNTSC